MRNPRKSDQLYVEDMLAGIENIEKYMADVTFETFSQEPMRQDAVIRQLQVIGEAAGKLSHDFKEQNPDFPVKYSRMIRNFLVHNYDEVDTEIIWHSINETLPSLKKQIQAIL